MLIIQKYWKNWIWKLFYWFQTFLRKFTNTLEQLLSTEMNHLRRSCRLRRVDRVRNETIRNMMGMERDIVDEVQRKQLIWYGHMCRMDEERISNRVLQWTPPEKRKRGRPRRGWMDDVHEAMHSRNLNEEDS